jgi:hypothetical protein
VNLETKLAAALLTLGDITHEHAKLLTARQIISLYQFDHYPRRKADGGPDAPWNIRTPREDGHNRSAGDGEGQAHPRA